MFSSTSGGIPPRSRRTHTCRADHGLQRRANHMPLWESRVMRLSEDMKRVVLEQRLGFVATVTPDGRPNLSPKGTTTVLDDEHLLFADIASPGTVANLTSSPFVEVNVVDPIRRKGYRFKGKGEVHR